MYQFEHDAKRALFVARMTPGGDEQGDFDAHIAALRAALADANGGRYRLALLMLFENGHEIPNALSRRSIANAQSHPNFKVDIAIVSNNPLLRGALTALDWLRGTRLPLKVTTDPDAGVAALEQMRGGPCPGLREMVGRVQARGTGRAPAR